MKFQELSNFKLPSDFRGRNPLFVQLWWFCEATLFRLSPQYFYGWRRFILRMFGANIGKGVLIRPSVKVTYPWKLSIGDFSWIGDDVVLYSLGDIIIGNNVVISQKSYLCSGGHLYSETSFPIFSKNVSIENECWISTDVFIGPGVTIGHGTVVGARSSVFTNLPPGKICFGSPATIIRER